MKKLLLSGLMLMGMAAGQVNAQSLLCEPTLTYGSYCCISKVEIAGFVNESTIPQKWTSDFAFMHEDFTADPDKYITLTPGKTYDMTVTVCNFGSTFGDLYYVTTYFDWNNDYDLTTDETVHQETITMIKAAQDAFMPVTFKVTVPEDAQEGTMRCYVHYNTPDVPYTDPCCTQDSGQYEDYHFILGETNSINEVESASFNVYPNPTKGLLNVEAEEGAAYSLFSLDGRLMQQGFVANGMINVAGNAAGTYLLQVVDNGSVKQTQVIVE